MEWCMVHETYAHGACDLGPRIILGFDPGSPHSTVIGRVANDGKIHFQTKENKMRKREEIEREAKQLERRLSSLVVELEKIDNLPAEPGPDGTIVRFDVRYTPSGVSYSYAALKSRGAWWLTGREKGGRSWEELLEFMSGDYRIQQDGEPIMFRVFDPNAGATVVQGAKS